MKNVEWANANKGRVRLLGSILRPSSILIYAWEGKGKKTDCKTHMTMNYTMRKDLGS